MSRDNGDSVTVPEVVRVEFVGIPGSKEIYRGDGIVCDLSKPGTCQRSVSKEFAAKVLSKFPKEWKLMGDNATETNKIRRRLIELADEKGVVRSSVYAKTGGAKIIFSDGISLHLPPNARITVETPDQRLDKNPEEGRRGASPIAKARADSLKS